MFKKFLAWQTIDSKAAREAHQILALYGKLCINPGQLAVTQRQVTIVWLEK